MELPQYELLFEIKVRDPRYHNNYYTPCTPTGAYQIVSFEGIESIGIEVTREVWSSEYVKDTRKWYQKLYKRKNASIYTLKTVTNYVPLEDFQVRAVERRTFATVKEK